jgi:hypothetical protein
LNACNQRLRKEDHHLLQEQQVQQLVQQQVLLSAVYSWRGLATVQASNQLVYHALEAPSQ